MLWDALDLALWFLHWIAAFVVDYGRRHPVAVILAVVALLRTFGTTVQTGQAGVLFFCGRVRKVLEPGFHPLIPILQAVRKLPIRSITLNLPKQRVAGGDGLVYDVDANIVVRVEDPIKAVTLIDNLTRGVTNVVPLVVHDLLREKGRQELANRGTLDSELTERCRARLARWGLTVEQAGFSSIAPTRRSIRLTQLRARVMERRLLMKQMDASGAERTMALLLGAAGQPPLGHAAHRYRRSHRLHVRQRRLTEKALVPVSVPVIPPEPGEQLAMQSTVRESGAEKHS